MKLAEILHLCLISRRTGSILFRRDGEDGKLWIEEGQLYHAEFGGLAGEDATYKMLESESGDASFLDGVRSTEHSIARNSEHLLMEAARRADEKSKTRKIPLPPIHPVANALATSVPRLLQYNVLGEAKTNVGRSPNNDLCLSVDSVSSVHCGFEVRGQKVVLSDHHSLNGTFINGQRVIDPVELHEGDTIHIGSVALRFYWMTQPESSAI
jgi:hypothetical protein